MVTVIALVFVTPADDRDDASRPGHTDGGAATRHGGYDDGSGGYAERREPSAEELRGRRNELDHVIAAREQSGRDPTPTVRER